MNASKVSVDTVRSRGNKVMLKHGGLPEVISPHLVELIKNTGGIDGPIGRQFVANPHMENINLNEKAKDPLIEDEFEVAPGLVYKYKGVLGKNGKVVKYGRALWTVTRFCSTYCRFCTRGREVGIPTSMMVERGATIARKPFLDDAEVEEVVAYIKAHKEINEIIVSGGDPLVAPQAYITKIIDALVALQKGGDIDVIRVGTRMPIHNPNLAKDWHYDLLSKIRNAFLMVHINHPAEITEKTVEVLNRFRRESLATVMSQTVLLKGVNDSTDILVELFNKMVKEGIRPYYVYQNDPVYWANHFTVDIKEAIRLWNDVRPRLSGVAATARFVIDTPYGFGKIPVPEGNAWKVDYGVFRDFEGNEFDL